MGEVEFTLMMKYANSSFDTNYSVKSYDEFDEGQFLVFNNFNWLLATKASVSPLHSLFFTNGVINK
jgi:hypothetical protein